MKNSKLVYLVNVGEPLPVKGNREHRMCAWKRQLESDGFDVIFFTTDFEHQRKQWIHEAPQGFILLKSFISYEKNIGFGRLINHFLLFFSLFYAFKSQNNKPDVIVVSYPTILISLASLIYAKVYGLKVVVDVRDKWPDIFIGHPFFILFLWPLYLIKKIVFRYADNVIAVSPNYYKWAVPNSIYRANCVLPLAIASVPIIEREISTTNPIRLIFVGTLGSSYDLKSIILIHDILYENKISFTIDVCGDGPKRNWFESQIVLKENIIFHGWLSKLELQEIIDGAHFGLMLYNSDASQGWPNKLIEYMANGLPIVNTLKGEAWDLIEQDCLGINCYSGDLNVLVNWIICLIQNESKYKGYVSRNYEVYMNRFHDEAIYNKLKKIIL